MIIHRVIKKLFAYSRLLSSRVVASRRLDGSLTAIGAAIEAEKCLLCVDAPCATACPAGTQPDKFIRQLRFDNYLGGAETILDNNVLGGVCGTVCPVSRLCEGACTRSNIDGPVKIGRIQRYLHDLGMREDIELPPIAESSGRKAAVIGSGPAGLSAARELARRGSIVTIFERRAEPGGALRYALSPFRIDHAMVDAEIDRIKKMGVKFECNVDVSDVRALTEGFDSVFVSPGLQISRSVDIKNQKDTIWESREGIVSALSFLDSANSSMSEKAKEAVFQKKVVVIGGGSVAMDCAITARSLGAISIDIVSIESILNLPADIDEIELARNAGVVFHPEAIVTSVSGTDQVIVNHLLPNGEPSERTSTLEASTIIVAAGQMLDETGRKIISCDQGEGVTVLSVSDSSWNSKLRKTPLTVVSGGDAVRGGGDTVVRAIADGKFAAEAMIPDIIPPRRHQTSLETEFVGINFMNPFTLSSSPVTNSADMIARAYDAGFAGSYYKTLNREDQFVISHPSPRLNVVHAAHKGMEIGIQNVEQISDRPLADNLADILWLRKHYPKHITAVSIMGFSDEDWAYLAAAAEGAGAHMLELNFSCPQMARSDAGHHVGQQTALIERFTAAAKAAVSIPVIAKLTPNITDMVPSALAAQQGGADGVSAINTLKSISHVDLKTMNALPNVQGKSSVSGFSGKGCRPIGLRFVSELGRDPRLKIPISGMGGIYTWQDGAEYLSVGASNLQVTTSVMQHGVRIVEDMVDGLQRYMKKQKVNRVVDLVGAANKSLVDPSQLDTLTEVVSVIDKEKCIGCGLCETSCRDGAAFAISMHAADKSRRVAEVNPSACVGCKLCQFVCPVDAISFETRSRIPRRRFFKKN